MAAERKNENEVRALKIFIRLFRVAISTIIHPFIHKLCNFSFASRKGKKNDCFPQQDWLNIIKR